MAHSQSFHDRSLAGSDFEYTPEPSTSTTTAKVAVSNHYETSEEVYEAMDFEPVCTKNSPEQEREVEDEESDEDDEGENNHIWDYDTNQEIYAAVEDVEEEYEVIKKASDSSDSEDDYINVQQQLAEDEVDVYGEEDAADDDIHVQQPMDNDALDIYGGDENIYQNY